MSEEKKATIKLGPNPDTLGAAFIAYQTIKSGATAPIKIADEEPNIPDWILSQEGEIINLTQTLATEDMVIAGVVDVKFGLKVVRKRLTFKDVPTQEVILERAELLAIIASSMNFDKALVEAPAFMVGALVDALKRYNVQPVFAVFVREDFCGECGGKEVGRRCIGFVE